MINLIMGTAGHIDHGKTELIKSLSKIDCDTHPEEKTRGITINLGFANLDLSNDIKLGIVDVPGHKDFINTMVAGAFGIDFALLVVAADSGIMPQTVEHVKIMELLGITNGIVALTKVDLVENDLIEVVKNEIRKFLSATFLKNSEIIEVSSISGFGLSKLLKTILKVSKQINRNDSAYYFRMFIDRKFSVKGFGTVVTGSSLGGNLHNSDHIWLLPAEKRLRIRRIEQYGKEVQNISGSCRVSLNLSGVSKNDIRRGTVLCKERIKSTNMIDAKISLFKINNNFGTWFNAIFILGTYQNLARLHLIDKNRIKSGESGIVQIHLSEQGSIMRGDKFILRDTSGEFTLGGGEVIDAYPLHHKRRPSDLINKLERISNGSSQKFISHELDKNNLFVRVDHVLKILNINEKLFLKESSLNLEEDLLVLDHDDKSYFLKKSRVNSFEKKIRSSIEKFHKINPLYSSGKMFEEFLGLLKIKPDINNEIILLAILNRLEKQGTIRKRNNSWVLRSHKIELTPQEKLSIRAVNEYFLNSKMHVPTSSEINNERLRLKLSENQFQQIMNYLTCEKQLYNSEGNFIHSRIVDECRVKLLRYLSESSTGIKVAEFRDIIDGNRKICILLLNIYDSEELTYRQGDIRTITENGKKYLINYE